MFFSAYPPRHSHITGSTLLSVFHYITSHKRPVSARLGRRSYKKNIILPIWRFPSYLREVGNNARCGPLKLQKHFLKINGILTEKTLIVHHEYFVIIRSEHTMGNFHGKINTVAQIAYGFGLHFCQHGSLWP